MNPQDPLKISLEPDKATSKVYQDLIAEMKQPVSYYVNREKIKEFDDVFDAFQHLYTVLLKSHEVCILSLFDTTAEYFLEKGYYEYRVMVGGCFTDVFTLALAKSDFDYSSVYVIPDTITLSAYQTADLVTERAELRSYIKACWKDGSDIDYEKLLRLNVIHAELRKREMLDPNLIKERIAYVVCGWSERHGYFRSKHGTYATLQEAKKEVESLAKDNNWRIPTLIVKSIFRRDQQPAMVDFDKADINDLGAADSQSLVEKHSMGQAVNWGHLLSNFTDGHTHYTH